MNKIFGTLENFFNFHNVLVDTFGTSKVVKDPVKSGICTELLQDC